MLLEEVARMRLEALQREAAHMRLLSEARAGRRFAFWRLKLRWHPTFTYKEAR